MTDTISQSDPAAEPQVADVILALCAERGSDKTICPTEAAKAVALADGDETAWRDHLARVRRTAVGLACAGRLTVYRKGRPVDPKAFRGVYRLGLPRRP